MLLTLPATLLTLRLFLLVVDATMLGLVAFYQLLDHQVLAGVSAAIVVAWSLAQPRSTRS